MNIWHNTVDAPRVPRRVFPGQHIDCIVGTWPIEPGQSVQVAWELTAADGRHSSGTAVGEWRHNDGENSYWYVRLGPFADGDSVHYSVAGSASDGTAEAGTWRFRAAPALHVAWLWHQHQPLYRDAATKAAAPQLLHPWVRLHALRDYYSMPTLAADHAVRVTFNLTPVLLQQIDDYILNGTDSALELTRRRAEDLTSGEVDEILSTFFDADWHNQVYVHERYRELFEQRLNGAPFSRQDVRDLQMWFNLAWFGLEFRSRDVQLITGETVAVQRFARQQRGFSHDDVLAMIDDQYKILRAVVPLHRSLQDRGLIEVSTTPAFHPILPLLIDTDDGYIDRPGGALPGRFAWPEDAKAQVQLACADYETRFGRPSFGMWPAEGAVSRAAVDTIASGSIRWIATDAGVLARSGRWGYQTADPAVLCQPYRCSDEDPAIAVFFRDTDLSDGIGFRYGSWANADAAVDDFIARLESKLVEPPDDSDRILTIVLDGENAWGGYVDDARPFLHALYARLASDPRLKTVTFNEYIQGNPARGIRPHPVPLLTRVYDLATGSWIDEPASAPGVDLGTWIGDAEENAAWKLLGGARSVLASTPQHVAGFQRAREALLASEGSDWFWWFGGDQDSGNDAAFDELFRAHLREAYEALDLAAPSELNDYIVAHPAVWTFTRPFSTLRPQDRVSIRTNCPGRLVYRLDDSPEESASLVAVGGVMAGTRRFQLTLGPFVPSAHQLAFRFACEHPRCEGGSACCLGQSQVIVLDAQPPTRRADPTVKRRVAARGSDAKR